MTDEKQALLNLYKIIVDIFQGIDETESDSDFGWWETSAGADFGKKKLNEVRKLLLGEFDG